MAGQGTIGLEILDDVPDLDAVIVPVGGGGLIAGIATAVKHLKPNAKIYVCMKSVHNSMLYLDESYSKYFQCYKNKEN